MFLAIYLQSINSKFNLYETNEYVITKSILWETTILYTITIYIMK